MGMFKEGSTGVVMQLTVIDRVHVEESERSITYCAHIATSSFNVVTKATLYLHGYL